MIIEVILKSGSFKRFRKNLILRNTLSIFLRKMALMGGATLDEAHPVRDSFLLERDFV